MKKEQIKTIALGLLVAANLVLGSNILLDKKLWPLGYNFFNSEYFPIVGAFEKKSEDKTQERAEHLTMPEKIIVNTGDQTTRFSLNSNNARYSKMLEYCNEILVSAFSGGAESIKEAESEEWFSALMTKSVYLCYYTEYETGLFADFLGIKEPAAAQSVAKFSNVVVGLSDNVSVYIEDSVTGKYYRIKTGRRFEEFKEITERFIEEQAQDSGSTINYSFDLKFDMAFEGQKTIIASMVPIYQNKQSVPVIEAKNALMEDSKPNNAAINRIVRIFGVNPNTARRYTEADGTIVYVENNATLKLGSDGWLEYKARDAGLSFEGADGGYGISRVNDFVSSVNEAAGSECDIYISSAVENRAENITFDYVCSGRPIKLDMDNAEHAVSCTLSGGYITEYRHILRNYRETGEYITTPEYITAVDDTIQSYSDVTGNITINKLYLAYKDDGLSEHIGAEWCAEVEAVVLGKVEE